MLVVGNQTSIQESKSDRESPLDRMLKRIHRSEEFPSISKYLIEINQQLSNNPDTSDASELSNVILKDYALTNKLLKLVNSAYYGFAAGKVSTVTRAVVVLGYEHIRLATISLVLFEHFKSKSNASDLKDAVVSSFWSGVLARDIAKMQSGIDPEEAFVCAMMGQLGKLVMIYYLPEEYRNIVQRMMETGENETKAAKAACGVTYEALAVAVAKQWNFPDQICESLQKLTNDDLKDKHKPPAKLRALSNLVRDLSNRIQGEGLIAGDGLLENLVDRYQSRIKLSKRQLRTLIKDSVNKVHQHAQALQFNLGNSRFIKQLSGELQPENNRGDGKHKDEASSFQLTSTSDFRTDAASQMATDPKDIIMEGIQEISEAMMADHDANAVALMSLEILYRALQFNRALMFIRDGRSNTVSVRFGYGQDSQRLTRKVQFKISNAKDLFNLSIQVGKDLIVADAADSKMNHLIPEWYRTHIDAPAFIFLPVLVQKVCIGAFYADRASLGQPISDTEHRHLSMLRNQLVLAIKYRQSAR